MVARIAACLLGVGASLIAITATGLFSCQRAPAMLMLPLDIVDAEVPKELCEGMHAVYVYDVASVDFHHNGMTCAPNLGCATSRMSKIHLCTRAATESDRYGSIVIEHPGPLYRLAAYVQKADGRKVFLGQPDFKKTVVERDAVRVGEHLADLNRTTIVYPGLAPGDTIAYRYMTPLPIWSWSFQRDDAVVLHSQYQVAERVMERSILKIQVKNPDLIPVGRTKRDQRAGSLFSDATKRAFIAGSAMMALMFLLSAPMISAGVPVGPPTPAQPLPS